MKPVNRALRDAARLGDTLADVATSHGRHGELALASGGVVAKRMALGAAAMVDPLNADHAEFARMVPEKAQAFADAGAVLLQRSGAVAQQMAKFAANEMALAMRATVALAACRTPSDLAAAQARLVTAWLGRAMSQAIALNAMAVRSQAAAMAPVHRTATANARRLGR
jgi:Phasin protein